MQGPNLRTKGLELRPPSLEDAANFYRWSALPELRHLFGEPPKNVGTREARWFEAVVSAGSQLVWAIYNDDQHIGFTGVFSVDWTHKRGWAGTWLGQKAVWHHGLGTEAVRLRNDFVFSKTSLEKLQIDVPLHEKDGQSWVQGLGYKYTGTARHHFLIDGKWIDVWQGELLKSEWKSQR